ncbi:hypothetical protein KIN20_029510 [Parelaphostrongylus tenuis]|uniref:Uncharacterized protein n=1 Tax=Parelaphostrongylus tenuis TaxID=148309 RepID=A0AAD5R2H7_PARTN|nr:hypothetical protein KIN20_029510 [Parelaphostrongylus tenuis]
MYQQKDSTSPNDIAKAVHRSTAADDETTPLGAYELRDHVQVVAARLPMKPDFADFIVIYSLYMRRRLE